MGGLSLDQIGRALARPRSHCPVSAPAGRGRGEGDRAFEAGGPSFPGDVPPGRSRRPLDWKKITKIMEDIQMTEDTKKHLGHAFHRPKKKEFDEIGKKYTPQMMQPTRRNWAALIEEVKAHLGGDRRAHPPRPWPDAGRTPKKPMEATPGLEKDRRRLQDGVGGRGARRGRPCRSGRKSGHSSTRPWRPQRRNADVTGQAPS